MALKRIRLENGEYLDSETYQYVQMLSIVTGINLLSKISNGSYSTRVKQSGGTHAGAGVFDLMNLTLAQHKIVVAAWRKMTAGKGTGWVRLPSQGDWNLHSHYVLVTEETSPGAVNQYKAYVTGKNGLGKADDGPRDWVNSTGQIPTGGALTNVSPDPNVVGVIPDNPLTQAFDIYKLIADPSFIRRALYFVVGLLLIIIGTFRITAKALPLDLITKIGK